MKIIVKIGLLVCIAFGFIACEKNNNDLQLQPVNVISIGIDTNTYNVLLPDSLKVNVRINESIPSGAGIRYEWVMYPNTGAPLTRRTLDTTQNLAVTLIEDPGSYVLILYARDRKTNIEFQQRFFVNVLTAYSEGWVVLEEKGGQADLSMIMPNDVVLRNAYSINNSGAKLPAGSKRIPVIRTNRNDQKVFVLSPNGLTQLNFSNFRKIATEHDLFWQAPNPFTIQEIFLNGDEEVSIVNGKPHFRSFLVSGVQKFNQPPAGSYYFAPFETYSTGYYFYDTVARKFVRFDANTLNIVPVNPAPAGSLFDMNNIGKRMIYSEQNVGGQHTAIFKNVNNDSLFAFNYNPSAANPAISRFDGLQAPGLENANALAMSKLLPHLYYNNGNQIFRLDIPSRLASSIFSFPAGTEIKSMKIYINRKNFADPNNNKILAVATQESGQGKVYFFPIASTGLFTNNTFSKVIGGFDMINEITYKSLK